MEKEAKIVKAGMKNSGQGNFGPWFSKNITLDNGDEAKVFDPSERIVDELQRGVTIKYTMKAGARGNSIKISEVMESSGPQSLSPGAGGGISNSESIKQDSIARQCAFKGAVEIAVHVIPEEGGMTEASFAQVVERLTNKFHDLIVDGNLRRKINSIIDEDPTF